MSSFALDLAAIRERALLNLHDGPITAGYEADAVTVVNVLNEVVATEIVCALRYRQHAIVAAGIDRGPVAAEFAEHSEEELQHCLWVAERINQLGGTPDLDPGQLLNRSQTEYRVYPDTDLEAMLKENLVAERVVIQTYHEIIRWLGDRDPTTRRLMERILEQEEDHADDLRDLLGDRA